MKPIFSLIFIFSLILGWSPRAGAVATAYDYACLGIDGVPISRGSELDTACCNANGLIPNPPDTCRAGFNSIGVTAGGGAATSMALAQQAIDIAKGMNGATTDLSASPTPSRSADTNALISGANSGSAASGATDAGSATAPSSKAASAGGGTGGSGSVSGNALSGSASTGTDSKQSTSASSEGAGANSAGAYSKNGGGAGANGKEADAFGFGKLFGGGENGAGKGDEENANLKFSGDENGAANGTGKDGDSDGTTLDPADYLSRIDKSASIFKIMSARYGKEIVKNHVK